MNHAETILADLPISNTEASETETSSFATINTASEYSSLRDCVKQAIDNYFKHLDGQKVSDVYELVMAEVEAPLLEVVMQYTRHNQTKAAQVLGLNRGTLRKKLKQYGQL
ncbi:DNA-binding transcriptional regulator Fis [Marinibactrum halimedae]|uniref:Putative Fis-like DNA-binding protein n=1 Tax=Marinibactrum halimedae TaxID=1444977 RepID=A0AA37T8D9_9GAMM|nr:DNA-binding transcriptional regulator Fis [Marinibactrum halimedae]MCD9459935.1 DNA-binding transcriptional regulator Fis [Marinibactrum halimedae]GLS25210.1 DNA-binding protein Fis [Marinibactrum halimedae]